MGQYIKKITSLDFTLSATTFAVVITLLLSLGVASILLGPSSADDAWIALAAKNLAVGKGYATSISDSKLIPFDPFISTGPPLVFPTSIAIHFFGNMDWVPGAVQLFIYVIQITIVALLLAKRFGWGQSLFFTAILNFLLIVATLNFWLYGALLGEPVAFGFILIGVILLAAYTGLWPTITAVLCFSFAFMTKQISLFPIFGILCALFAINIDERRGIANVIQKFFIIALVFLSIPLVFETIKLLTLGYKEYIHTIKLTMNFAVTHENGAVSLSDRFSGFLDVFSEYYIRPAIASLIILASMFSLISFFNYDESVVVKKDNLAVKRFFALALCGAILLFFYVIFISPRIWPRYLWIGIAIALVAMSAFLLVASFTQKIIFLSITLILFFVFDGYRLIFSFQNNLSTRSIINSERNEVVRFLDDNPGIPYAAEYWSSIYDVVYLRENEGHWRFGPDIQGLYGTRFFAVINNQFTDKNSNFYRSVNASCKPIIHSKHFGLFDCSKSFWLSYH